ncbi:MAG: hypothetical protein GDA35_01245 [Hyphomonadaceae bacterium]|nr:hypothetical protein [Hyphomonadaceae bacterium]
MAAGGDEVALVIKPGVTVFGRNDVDHIVVSTQAGRGGRPSLRLKTM